MTTPENKTKNIIKKYLDPLKKEGSLYYFMPSQGKFSNPGVPDFIICFKGQFLAIEAKAEGKADNTTLKQEMNINQINNAGGFASVVSNKEEMELFVTTYLK